MTGAAHQSGQLRTFARPDLLREVSNAKVGVALASPFLTLSIAEELTAALPEGRSGQLLTALVDGSVRVGALRPDALLHLKERGWEVRSIRNLHAKVSIVDSHWGLVGSGNLTNAGLGSTDKGNLELGVILSPSQIREAAAIFDGWWGEARAVSASDIAHFEQIPVTHPEGGSEDGVGPALEIGDPADLDELLGDEDPDRRYWVKANYHKRDDAGRGWWHRGWISDSRHASYTEGDLILLYLGAAYEGPRCCPAIVRVTRPALKEPEFVAANGDPEAEDRWPWVSRTECVSRCQSSRESPSRALG